MMSAELMDRMDCRRDIRGWCGNTEKECRNRIRAEGRDELGLIFSRLFL